MYNYVLFDLDGTLTNPAKGITNSVVYALNKFGIEVEDKKALYKFIGPPLVESFMEYYGFSKEKALEAVRYYREYFSVKGLYENEVYDGVLKVLNTLKEKGKSLIIASSKPEKFVNEILRHFNLLKYFDFIAGASMDERRNSKDAVIAYAMENCPKINGSTAIMVGDRSYDVLGAKVFQIDCIGVSYGFGGKEELEKAGVKYLAYTPEEILDFIM